mgnify:CR=1 FL=1
MKTIGNILWFLFGGLIGGASLKPADFAAIVKAACEAAK